MIKTLGLATRLRWMWQYTWLKYFILGRPPSPQTQPVGAANLIRGGPFNQAVVSVSRMEQV
jgi:hypothetical protein